MPDRIATRLCTGLFWIGLISLQAVAASPLHSTAPASTKSPGTHCTLDLPDNHSLHLIWIPAGTFLMGQYANEKDAYANETPRHQVVLSRGFWLGQTAITQGQWRAVMHTEPWSGKPYVNPDENSPAVYVSWDDTQLFVKQITALSGKTFRLPTEAEREYACRAGTSTRFYWGEDLTLTAIDRYAWWRGTVLLSEKKFARPVGTKRPNPWKLFDMAGNVYEWCQDWYGVYPNGPLTDPPGPVSGIYRVQRGGSWTDYGSAGRSAHRRREPASAPSKDVGFRLVMEP